MTRGSRSFQPMLTKIESDVSLLEASGDSDGSTVACGSDVAASTLLTCDRSPWADDALQSCCGTPQLGRQGSPRAGLRFDLSDELCAQSEEWGRSTTPNSVASSGWQYAEPTQTLIFLDWDDTLFPCTELFERWRLPRRVSGPSEAPLPEELQRELEPWRTAVEEYLTMVCALTDRCVIVTNSSPPWVESCVQRFAPNLRKFFNGGPRAPRVAYAGEARRRTGPGKVPAFCCCPLWWQNVRRALEPDPTYEERRAELTEAKLTAMRREATSFYSRYPGQTWKNIISLGDMRYERDAVQELSASRVAPARERLRTKAFVLPSAPSLPELTLWLRLLCLLLPALARLDGDVDADLSAAANPMQAIGKALSLPHITAVSLPQLGPSGASAAAASDGPGVYRLTYDATFTCASLSTTLGQVMAGNLVEVLEVVNCPSSRCVRGRIAEPPDGWLSLASLESGQRWAEREDRYAVEEALDEVAVAVQDALFLSVPQFRAPLRGSA